MNLVSKFEESGSVLDAPWSGRPQISNEAFFEISLAATNIGENNANGESSSRAVATATGHPQSTMWKAMTKILQMDPYQIQTRHLLLPAGHALRLAFAEDFLMRVETNPDWLDSILWTDKANFTLSGQRNLGISKSARIRSTSIARYESNCLVQHFRKFYHWPYFFEEVDGNGEMQMVTVNG